MRKVIVALLACLCGSSSSGQEATATRTLQADESVSLSPFEFREGLNGDDGLITVSENRAVAKSRSIQVDFFRIAARRPSKLPPVFILPGGPGGHFSAEWAKRELNRPARYGLIKEIAAYTSDRDVVIVNQRGNAQGAGLESKAWYIYHAAGRRDEPWTFEDAAKRYRDGTRSAFELWRDKVDLAGYDIINMVEDVDAVRLALGYEKVVLRGTSFGSQWSLAYMKRHPDRVDRAVLAGVEPLDHGYDSPQGLWRVLERIEEQAKASGHLANTNVGLLDAVKKIVERLEMGLVAVEFDRSRGRGTFSVTIGPDDFRDVLRQRFTGSEQSSLAAWPKFVYEIYNGDYRFLGNLAVDRHGDVTGGPMLVPLIDNSLGISPVREIRLNGEPAKRWLGEVNWHYLATRDITPTPVVSDEFREFQECSIPVLMVQGDMDLSTPFENATELLEFLPHGHLIRVNGGTHSAIQEITLGDRQFMNHLKTFVDADFEATAPSSVFQSLPTSVDLPALKFLPLDGPSLYENMVQKR